MNTSFMAPNSGELPLGYIFEFDPTGITGAPDLSTAEKVHDYFGYGAWEDYGSGRVTIGVSNTHAISTEGGEEKHTLFVTEMPDRVTISYGAKHDLVISGSSWTEQHVLKDKFVATSLYDAVINDAINNITEMNKPHNNMQPYKTVYRWRRIA